MKISILLLLIIACHVSLAQQIDYTKVESVLTAANAEKPFSAVVLIAEKGKIKYQKAFGYRRFADQTTLKKTDIFELASVSKQFTAMAIMMLKERGLLNYDDLINQYVSVPYQGISIRNLLTHTSGLPDYHAIMDQYWDKTKVAGNPDIIDYLNKYHPPILFEPGTKYAYSNTGYVLLASIAEKVSGMDFISFANKEIFGKLGMKHTAIRTLEEKAAVKNFAIGHIYVKEKNEFVRADSFPSFDYTIWLGNRKGPGRISSTAADLLKWDRALYTEKLVTQKTLAEAFTPFTLKDGKISNYGFGWVTVLNDPSGKIVWHDGDNPGYKTEIMRFLGKEATLIILCNNYAAQFATIVKELQKIITSQ